MLGYSPQNLKFDGNYHGLKVTVKNAAGLSIQARQGLLGSESRGPLGRGGAIQRRDSGSGLLTRRNSGHSRWNFKPNSSNPVRTPPELTVTAHLDLKGLLFRKN